MTIKTPESNPEIKAVLKTLSQRDFRNFGLHHIAYIRQIRDAESRLFYAVHAADGSRLYVTEQFQDALLTAKVNDLEPVTLQ